MPNHPWRKSTFSGDGSNCVYVSANPTGTVRLRESDIPDSILATTAEGFRHLIDTLKPPSADSPHD
ncbi:DUF397 domain-containing protein [Streptomyces sp. NPDC050528]|uniref:DUF397 domain-containing protein n=1 Tax=Streptomyces sp. NPDC050528 TaxID=3365623 RepID=UPI003787B72B